MFLFVYSDLNISMFDSSPNPSDRNNSEDSLNHLRDGLASITHRVGELEALLSKKMDRSECLGICEKKVSQGQVKRALEEIQNRLRNEKNQQVQRNLKMQQLAIEKISELSKKLKTTIPSKAQKNNHKGTSKDANKRIIQPQQLFIESNQTMFSLLIEEIYKLQSKDDDFQRQFELRNKKMISLNNQVCSKIQKLEAEMDQKLKFNSSINDSKLNGNTWSHLERTNKATVHKCLSNESNQFEAFRFDTIAKTLETLQRELLTKMNLKDVLPIIKQNYQQIAGSLEEVREYVEQSMESTKRILSSQTEINKEMSMGVKVAWWHSFEQEHQFALINKEIINLVPEIVEIGKGKKPNYIRIVQQGIYLVKIYPIESDVRPLADPNDDEEEAEEAFEIMVDTNLHICGRENAIRLEKNSELRVIQRVNSEMVFCLQKL